MTRSVWILAVAVAGTASPVPAQRAGPAPAGPGEPAAAGAEARRRTGAIEIDGRLSEPAWADARTITEFVQGEPVQGAAALRRTRVHVLFDEEAIYVGASLEEDPGDIARQLFRRDAGGQADYFEVAFDPNRDRRTGYQFRVSASGVQRDAYLYEDTREDDSWDAVWEANAAVVEDGWSVELRIPWSQLRYQPSEEPQTWGVNFVRWRVKAGERTYHALVPRNEHGRVSFFRPLAGVHVPGSLRRIEIQPYALARGHTGPADPDNPFFDGREADAQAGVDLRYGLGSAFTIDATLNPDFGQVELDPAVINLSAFETFFPEKRPFFVEDARIFDFALSGRQNTLFYSRRIGREPQGEPPEEALHSDVPDQSTILGAAKLTGRTGRGLSVGALAALTGREEGRTYLTEPSGGRTEVFVAQPRAYHGVLRLQQDLREGNTTVGAILTGVRRDLPGDGSFDFLPSDAYTGGVDFEHMWRDREWAVEGFLAGSLVRGDTAALVRIQESSNHYFQRPDSDLDVDSARTALAGAEWRLELERRSGEHWTGSVWLGELSPGFEINDLGFSRSREQLDAGARLSYSEIRPGRIFRDYEVTLMTFQNWRHSALDAPWSARSWGRAYSDASIWLEADATFNNLWGVRGEVAYRPEVLDDGATRGGPLMLRPASRQLQLSGHTDRRRNLGLELDLTWEGGRRFHRLDVGGEVTWRPTPRLELELAPEASFLTEESQYVETFLDAGYAPTYGSRYLFGALERRSFGLETRLNLTFTRDLTLQLFLQPLVEAGDYTAYRQLAAPATFDFLQLRTGTPSDLDADGVPDRCAGGDICEADDIQYLDFDGDERPDASFEDRDFNVVSLRGNAVLRWEYHPGSTVFVVWQQRRFDERPFGDFDLGRDRADLLDIHPDNVFIIKVNYWLGL